MKQTRSLLLTPFRYFLKLVLVCYLIFPLRTSSVVKKRLEIDWCFSVRWTDRRICTRMTGWWKGYIQELILPHGHTMSLKRTSVSFELVPSSVTRRVVTIWGPTVRIKTVVSVRPWWGPIKQLTVQLWGVARVAIVRAAVVWTTLFVRPVPSTSLDLEVVPFGWGLNYILGV